MDKENFEIKEYNSNIAVTKNSEEEIDLIEIIKVIWKNKKLILIVTIVVTILSVILMLLQPRQYKADCTFTVEISKNSTGGLSALASSFPLALKGNNDDGNIKVVMESRTFREDVIKNNNLMNYYINKKSGKDGKKGKKGKKSGKETTIYDVAKWLDGIVKIDKDDKTGVYTIDVMIADKEMAPKIAQMYYSELQTYLRDKKMTKAKLNRIYVDKQVAMVEAKLSEKEDELKMIEKRYNSVSIGDEAKAVAEMTTEIKKGILEKTNQLNILKEFAGEENIDVKKLEKELAVYKKQLIALQTGGKNVPVDVVPLNDIPSLKIKLERLEREITATAEVYKMLLVQAETAKMDEIKDSDVLNMIDSPIEPEFATKPNRKLGVLIGFVMGVFLGVFLAFTKEFLSTIDFKKIMDK